MAENQEEQRRNLTQAIGECILAWAEVEYQLSLLFAICMQSDLLIAATVFDSVVSLDARLAMINACISEIVLKAHSGVTDDHLAEWKNLSERIKKKYKKRNEIAHCAIVEYEQPGKTMELRVLSFSTVTREIRHDTVLRMVDLNDRQAIFAALSAKILAFRKTMESVLKQPPASPE